MTAASLNTESDTIAADLAPFAGRHVRLTFGDCCVGGEIVGVLVGVDVRRTDSVVHIGRCSFSGPFDIEAT